MVLASILTKEFRKDNRKQLIQILVLVVLLEFPDNGDKFDHCSSTFNFIIRLVGRCICHNTFASDQGFLHLAITMKANLAMKH